MEGDAKKIKLQQDKLLQFVQNGGDIYMLEPGLLWAIWKLIMHKTKHELEMKWAQAW